MSNDGIRNPEYKYKEELCGRCGSYIEYLPDEKPSQCPDCEWQGHPWGDKANLPKDPYDIPADIKISIPYSGPAAGLT